VDAYLKVTQDTPFLKEILPALDKEYSFWTLFRTVTLIDFNGQSHQLSVFSVTSDVPRPESYIEDLEMAEHFDDDKKSDFYSQMASGAESGWDYSSRWFANEVSGRFLALKKQKKKHDKNMELSH